MDITDNVGTHSDDSRYFYRGIVLWIYHWFDSADDLHVGRRIIWDFANHTAVDIVIVFSAAQYYLCGKPGQIAADSGLWFP